MIGEAGEERFVLHPALVVMPMEGGKAQIRGPGVGLTINDADHQVAASLGAGVVRPDAEDSSDTGAIVKTLLRNNLLVDTSTADHLAESKDAFELRVDLIRRQLGGMDTGPPDFIDRVDVQGTGILAAVLNENLAAFKQLDITSAGEVFPRRLAVVCSDCEDNLRFVEVNQRAVQDRQPALYVCLTENGFRIGPTVMPGGAPCFFCFYNRLRSGMHYIEQFDAAAAHRPGPEKAAKPANLIAAKACGALVTLQILKLLGGVMHDAGIASVLEVGLTPLRLHTMSLLRLPRCKACGVGRGTAPPDAIRDRRFWKAL